MKYNRLIQTVFIVGCILLLQIFHRGAETTAAESKRALALAKPVGSSAKGETTERQENEPAPRMKFEEVTHDFGKIGPGTYNTYEFKFTNIGDGLLKITREIESACGCTVPELSKKEYAPGESGSVKVKFHASSRTGRTKKHLYVHSNDKKKPKVKLTIKADVVLRVAYEPKKLKFLLRDEGVGCGEITLNSLDNKPFAITGFKSTGEGITADYDSSIEKTTHVIKPKLDVAKMKKGLSGRIDISLSHPECKTISIHFSRLPEFKISPSSINAFGAKPQKPIKRSVWIANNYNEDFEIESTLSRQKAIKVLSQEKVDKRYKLTLEMTPGAIKNNAQFYVDVLYVKMKGGGVLRIPFRAFPSRK